MSMKSLCRVSLLTIALTTSASFAADGLTGFKSVNVDLPFGDRMFEGPGADAANNNCLACHSVGMVLTQPPLSRQTWEAEVAQRLQGAHRQRRCDAHRRLFVEAPEIASARPRTDAGSRRAR
jgi:hypothetical protein